MSGMGEVYRAEDTKLDQKVAIKVVHEGFAQDAEAQVFAADTPPTVGKATALFPDRFENPQAGGHTGYDVFPDGRFLMIQSEAQPNAREEIIVVVNWIEELKQQFPAAVR